MHTRALGLTAGILLAACGPITDTKAEAGVLTMDELDASPATFKGLAHRQRASILSAAKS